LLRKYDVRVEGSRVAYADSHQILLADVSSGTPTESVLATESQAFDLGSSYAYVGGTRIDLASRATTIATRDYPEVVSCDDTYVAFLEWVPSDQDVSYQLEIRRVGSNTLVRKIQLPSAEDISLAPGAVANGRVAVTIGPDRVLVYDIGTGAAVRDFVVPDPQVVTVGPTSAVLAGDRLVWTDSVRAFAATLGASPATSTVADVRGTTDRLIGSLTAGGDRVAFAEWTVVGQTYKDSVVKMLDLVSGTTKDGYAKAAASPSGPDEMYDVGSTRFAWLDQLSGGSALDYGPVVGDEVWETTDAGPAVRVDTQRYAENDQISPKLAGGRLAWLDDGASPADASTCDLMLRDVASSAPATVVESGLYSEGGDSGGSQIALSDRVLAYVKSAPAMSSSGDELWTYDIASGTKRRIARNLMGTTMDAYGPWVVYSSWGSATAPIIAYDTRDGSTRTIFSSAEGMSVFSLSHGLVYYMDNSGVSWTFDLATGAKAPSKLPMSYGFMGGPFSSAPIVDQPRYLAIEPHGYYEHVTDSGPGWYSGESWDYGTEMLGNLDTGERFATDPFTLDTYGPRLLSGRWMFRTDMLMDITSADCYSVPAGDGWADGGAIDGDRAALETYDPDQDAYTVSVYDLSGIVSPTRRIGGANRVATGIGLSSEMATASTVVIATARNFPDALAGVPLAYAVGGPVLLTEPGALSSAVASEVVRLGAKKAYILGSSSAVSGSVEGALGALGVTDVTRLQGANRYATAAAIAGELKNVIGHSLGTAFVATGGNFPDALSAAAVAARMGAPILLTQSAAVPSVTKDAIASVGATGAVVLGSEAVVTPAAASQLGVPVTARLGGAGRYDTCRQVVQYGFDQHVIDAHTFLFAIGNDFPDALGAGALAARLGVPLLLVNKLTPDLVPAPVAAIVGAHKAEVTVPPIIVGSERAVPLQLQERISQTLR
jgi:putative cell wall-binding protein